MLACAMTGPLIGVGSNGSTTVIASNKSNSIEPSTLLFANCG